MQDLLEETVKPIACFLHHVCCHLMADSRLCNEHELLCTTRFFISLSSS
uniref:Uncharacterized protein n=1 Tax=Arundo donax TaxID=35708 RepID=A0A0A9EP89_ARUDO